MKSKEIVCRNCGATNSAKVIPRYKSINILTLLVGGVIFALLYSWSRQKNFRCTVCNSRFSQRTSWGSACLIFFWIGIALLIIGFVTFEPD